MEHKFSGITLKVEENREILNCVKESNELLSINVGKQFQAYQISGQISKLQHRTLHPVGY